jgi:uncharacterized membrane protein YfcA
LIGPGTGTFLVVAFTVLVGADFVHGSAMAKVVNAGTNLGALVVFGVTGHVWWLLGLAMAVCNVVGAAVGARMALRRGAGFVRVVLLVVVVALVAKLGYDQWVARGGGGALRGGGRTPPPPLSLFGGFVRRGG